MKFCFFLKGFSLRGSVSMYGARAQIDIRHPTCLVWFGLEEKVLEKRVRDGPWSIRSKECYGGGVFVRRREGMW